VDYEALGNEIDREINAMMQRLKAQAKSCQHCNVLMFGTSKSDRQKYCSPECRTAYNKERKRARQQAAT
jgi:predicted nucleic acid-binding Zn ribbon protein